MTREELVDMIETAKQDFAPSPHDTFKISLSLNNYRLLKTLPQYSPQDETYNSMSIDIIPTLSDRKVYVTKLN